MENETLIQKTLDGFDASYHCKKCTKTFETMSKMIQHSKRAHKKKPEIVTHINFALENFKLVSTKTVIVKN